MTRRCENPGCAKCYDVRQSPAIFFCSATCETRIIAERKLRAVLQHKTLADRHRVPFDVADFIGLTPDT